MTTASRLNLRLFIDGIEVPVIGGRFVFADNSDAQAEVQVIPTDQVYDILPRAAIHVFYYESNDINDNGTGWRESGGEDPDRWKLLFFGELAGVSLQKTESQRVAILSCVGPMNYLDYIRQHYLNFRNGGIEYFENAFMGVKASQIKNFDVVGKGVSSNLFVWLSASKVKVDGREYSNIYTGTQRLIREMFFASSIFYSQAFNRLRIGDMIVGLPQDETAAKLMKLDFFQKFIKNRIGGGGGLVSARQMLDMLLGTVFHSATTVPCPRFDPTGEAKGLDIQTGASNLAQETVEGQPYPNGTLNYVVVKPDTWFLAPPACNVVFPHQYSNLTFQRNYLAEPTRLMLRTSLFFTGRDKWMTERFYSPDFEAINEVMYQKGGHLDRMASILLGHETFVGLNPIFLWESDIGAYVQKGMRREYLSALADYTFWKYRFSTRTMNSSGPFNPNLIPGYPGLFMDRTGAPGQVTRHVMGTIQSVVHSIDQNAGQTFVTMVGCHLHDETADYDGKGRSLVEVTRRGTDGFLDDRYELDSIGDEVYQKLFGCGSMVDFVFDRNLSGISSEFVELLDSHSEYGNDILTRQGPIPATVAILQILYQTAVRGEADVDLFTKSVTHRPKANMREVMGTADGASEGFHSACVDRESSVDDTYTSTRSYTKTTRTVIPGEPIEKTDPISGAKYSDGFTEDEVQTTTKTVKTSEQTSYGLSDMLKSRQAVVQSYVDSLKHRGSRG